ncbi:hypothetical protein KCP73_12575 [Salmonella enterica subsp. enterica]|nr:hypothetical protein KCP73_12575 [Salmonella enterica subsp. enterica]
MRGVGCYRFLSVMRNNPQKSGGSAPARLRRRLSAAIFARSNATDAASAGRRFNSQPVRFRDCTVLTLHHPLPEKSNASHAYTQAYCS